MKSKSHLFRTGSEAKRPALAPGRGLRTLLLFLLLLAPMPHRAKPRAVRVPFRTVQSMILIEGKIDEKSITFLLDTGSNHTIVDVRSYGEVQLVLPPAQRNRSATLITGKSVRLPVNLNLADHIWAGQCVTMMNLGELQQVLGISFDGLLGQDVLSEFRSVRIDYNGRVIELERWRAPHHANETMFRHSC